MVKPLEQDTRHKCEVFHCDHRGDRYCCFYCWRKGYCRNPCLNTPDKCGLGFVEPSAKSKIPSEKRK